MIFLIQHHARNKIPKHFLSIRQPDSTTRCSNPIRVRDSEKEKVAINNVYILFNIAFCQYFPTAKK